jgi:hypothetical protein
MATANVLSASRPGTGSAVITTTVSITSQVVGVGTVKAVVAAPTVTARQNAVTVISG